MVLRRGGGAAGAVRLQVLEDLAVAVLGEQAQADDHPADQPQGQARAVALGVAGLPEDLLNDGQRDDTFEGADALVGGLLVQQGEQRMSRRSHESLLGRWGCEQTQLARRLSPRPCPPATYGDINVCRSVRYWA
jgi:hypothetical protein